MLFDLFVVCSKIVDRHELFKDKYDLKSITFNYRRKTREVDNKILMPLWLRSNSFITNDNVNWYSPPGEPFGNAYQED